MEDYNRFWDRRRMDQRHQSAASRARRQTLRDFSNNSEALSALYGLRTGASGDDPAWDQLLQDRKKVMALVEETETLPLEWRHAFSSQISSARMTGKQIAEGYRHLIFDFRDAALGFYGPTKTLLPFLGPQFQSIFTQVRLDLRIQSLPLSNAARQTLQEALKKRNRESFLYALLEIAYAAHPEWLHLDHRLQRLWQLAREADR